MAAKILLVEDDNNLREIYEARLQAEGYAIVTAQDGEEALVVAKAEKPDLVISDVMMPRISGFEMLDILRNTEELKSIKVIMLTALGQAEDQTRANSLGADRYLVKSQVTLEDIVKATHDLLEGIPPAAAGTSTPLASTPMTPPAQPVDSSATPTTLPNTSQPVIPTPIPQSTTVPEPDTNNAVPPTTIPVVTPPEPVMAVPPTSSVNDDTTTEKSTIPETTQVTPFNNPVTPPVIPTSPLTLDTPETNAAQPTIKPTDLKAPTTQEEKDKMEAQIDGFAKSPDTVGPPPENSADQDSAVKDDAVLSTALTDLNASASAAPVTDPNTPKTVLPLSQNDPVDVSASAASSEPPTSDDNDTNNMVVIANKKIIQPLTTDPKPGLNELLAAEEAKNTDPATAATEVGHPGMPGPSPSPGSTFGPDSSPAAPSSNTPTESDPNNIAL
jgi:CheY-like chemotaxis protein